MNSEGGVPEVTPKKHRGDSRVLRRGFAVFSEIGPRQTSRFSRIAPRLIVFTRGIRPGEFRKTLNDSFPRKVDGRISTCFEVELGPTTVVCGDRRFELGERLRVHHPNV
jgi:hypothetical protein